MTMSSAANILFIAWFNLLARFLNGYRVPLETGDKLGSRTSVFLILKGDMRGSD